MNKKMSLTSYGRWQLIKCLGSGAFGEVHHWKHNISGQEIATKRLKANPKLRPDEINTLHKRWSQEYQWMKKLKTKFIVAAAYVNDNEFLQYLIEQSHVGNTLPVIIMEYCNGGDLRGQLNKIENINGLVEYEVHKILYALRYAVEYLHEKCNIEHRDIKPENIVSHTEGNNRIYKLTDFGYAREIPDSTIAQSVVGTRNYVAPEIIDPGCYTKTIDYWSTGNVAYEIISGTQPFIPHQLLVKRIEAIKAKPSTCIAIIQKVDDPTNDNFEFIDHILPQNHCSSVFIEHIEKWLCMSLDKDYKSRGRNNLNQLKFFTDLDEILSKKVLTVFSLKKYEKYYYDIESFLNMQEFIEKLAFDNEIRLENIFLILPPLHPKTQIQHPMDYFVPEWCNTGNQENPPVMLFVNEFIKQSDCNIQIPEHFKISATIKKCMSVSPQDSNIPSWLLHQFEKEIHYLITKEQYFLQCYMMGLHGFVMQIEHAVFYYEREIIEVNDKSLILRGHVQLLATIIDEIKNHQKGQESMEAKLTFFIAKNKELERCNTAIKNTYKSILQKCRELAQNEFYIQIVKDDIFGLKEYRTFLAHVNNNGERLEKTQHYFENCIKNFEIFLNKSQREMILSGINNEIKNFNSLKYAVFNMKNNIEFVVNEIEKETRSLLRYCHTNNTLSSQMNALNIDGLMPNASHNNINYPTNSSLDFDCDSTSLINDSLQLINSISYQCNLMNSSP